MESILLCGKWTSGFWLHFPRMISAFLNIGDFFLQLASHCISESPRIYVFAFLCWEKLNLQICLFLFQCFCVAFFEGEVKVLFCQVIVVGERVEVEDLVWS
jgi:hypothetical protein